MIQFETATSVTFVRGEGLKDTVSRSNIESLKSTGLSLMPEGLEKDISIEAMASKVPCMIVFKNNNELAAARATITMNKISAAVTAKGGDASKLKFSKRSSVGGPAWHNDHVERRAEFEKFQYVKCSAR